MQRQFTRHQFIGPVIAAAACAGSVVAGDIQYTIIDLTEQAEALGVVQAEARAINEAGVIVGFEALPDFLSRAIVWDVDYQASFLPYLADDNSNISLNITEAGTVLGNSTLVTVEQVGEILIITEDKKATLWEGGDLINLNDLVVGGDDFINLHTTLAASDAGQLVGFAGLPDDEGPPFFSNGFLFDDGIVTDLGMLQRPEAINNNLQIVGYTVGGQGKAYLWDNGVLTNLHDNVAITGVTSRAYGINDNGLIVGEAQFHISKPEEPTLWLDGKAIPLIPEINRSQGHARAVNAHNEIVGFYNDLDDLNSPWEGFLWKDGVRVDLLDVIDPFEGWQSLFPFDINDHGVIVGGGVRNGQLGRAFVMIPIVEGDLNGDAMVGPADLAILLGSWGPCPGKGDCPADLNGDGIVGPADLAILLGNWG